MAKDTKHTPGPWDYVPGNEHHGPYVTSDFGNTICDCYVMSEPGSWSVRTSNPIPHLAEMAEPNARLIAAAPDMYEALEQVLIRAEREFQDLTDGQHGKFADFPEAQKAIAALRKARGE